jgi:hypothetical protein
MDTCSELSSSPSSSECSDRTNLRQIPVGGYGSIEHPLSLAEVVYDDTDTADCSVLSSTSSDQSVVYTRSKRSKRHPGPVSVSKRKRSLWNALPVSEGSGNDDFTQSDGESQHTRTSKKMRNRRKKPSRTSFDSDVSSSEGGYKPEHHIAEELDTLAKMATANRDTERQLPTFTENGNVPVFVNAFCFGCKNIQFTVITDGKVHDRSPYEYETMLSLIQRKHGVRLSDHRVSHVEKGSVSGHNHLRQ